MNFIYRAQCCLFDYLLTWHSDELVATYGDEMRSVFRDELHDAQHRGTGAVLKLWSEVLGETVVLTFPHFAARLPVLLAACMLASGLTVGTALGFCRVGDAYVVHASTQEGAQPQSTQLPAFQGSLVQLTDGHHMFLECSGDPNTTPTVILANGRGLGTADAWSLVQAKISSTIRVCSYDAMGAGHSDKVQESYSIGHVAAEMHDLFQAARLKQPYVLVGASAGGVLIRLYQREHPSEVAGLVFVDSAHEEMEWRDAAISKQFDPDWNNPVTLRENGFLADQERLNWHANIPLIVLERTDLPPCSAFPGLNQQQCDGINAAWHSFQVDLSQRSKYGQLRSVAGSGHFMHRQRPDAIADAIQDVVRHVRTGSY